MFFYMQLKLREVDGSYIITIFKRVCDLFNFKSNNKFSIKSIVNNRLRLRKI